MPTLLKTLLLLAILTTTAQAKEIRVTCQNNETDATRINTAISTSAEGDEIIISGQALINQPIKLLGQRSYRGESRTGTTLKQADGANLVAIMASDSFLNNSPTTGLPLSISHLTILGNRTNNTAKTCGIIIRSWLSTIDDVQVRQAGGDGIRLTSLSENNTKLTNHQVNGRISNCFITDSAHHGLYVEDPVNACTDWMLTDNWIAQSGADGIHLDNGAGWYIDRNHVYGVPGHAIYVDRAYATSISNNYIEGFGETKTPGTYYGIALTLQGDVGSTITGNRIFNFGGEGNPNSTYSYIAITRVNYKTGYATITANIVHGEKTPKSIGLNYDKGTREGTALIITSQANNITNVGTPRSIAQGVTLNPGL